MIEKILRNNSIGCRFSSDGEAAAAEIIEARHAIIEIRPIGNRERPDPS